MFRLVVVTSLTIACCFGAAPRPLRPRQLIEDRIFGGQPVDIADYPFQVSLERNGVHACGGAIIDEKWVVTAAHCVDGYSEHSIQFRAGSTIKGDGGSLHPAAHIYANPNYDKYTIDSDIAVVKVTVPFKYGPLVQPISLIATEPSGGVLATVSGWGLTHYGAPLPDQLHAVSVPIVDRQSCSKTYHFYGGITQNMICAADEEGTKDSCSGDSGGPLTVDGKLAGLVSWGVACAAKGFPGVYSNLAALRGFITEVTRSG